MKERARECLESWLRGLSQGGHTVTPDEIRDAYKAILARIKEAD